MSARRKGKPQQRRKIESIEPEQDLLTCGDCQREFLLSDIVMFIQHKVSRCNKENVQPLDSCHQDEDDDDEDDDPDPYKTRSSSVGGGGGGGGGDGTGERGDVMNSMLATIISSHRTSISAPINRKDEPPTSTAEESHNASLVAAESSEVRDREGATEDDSEDKTQGKLSEKQHSDNNELDDDDDDAVKIVENGINGDSGAEISEHSSGKQKDDDSAKSLAKNKEPSIFTCGTCKSVYSSSWFLVQHVQKTHGLKIYEEPRDSSPPPSSTPSSIPARPIVVQPDKLLAEQLRGGKDSSSPAPLSPFHSSKPAGRASHRSPTCSPRGSSGGDMYSFPTPYMPGAPRQPAAAWPYGRPPMGSEFAAMMHPEIMMDQLRRLHGMVSAADHHAAIPGMPFLRPPQMDSSSQYSHSERLRLLAATGGNTSPKHIPPPPPPPSHSSSSNSRKQSEFTSPPTQSTPPSAFTTPTSSSSSTLLHDGGGGSGSGGTTPSTGRQHKQCEFCNKQFRFTSNLVLHRRLHTGEKPYSCPLCSFTSAQATKLRSHMRSHVTAPTATSSPQEHKLSDSDIEDSEEFVQREADAEAAIRQLQKDARKQKEQENNDVVDGEEATDLSALNADDMDRASLLSEVMMKTGLSSLPNYKEAFTAALAEVPSHNKSPQRHASSPKPEEGEKTEEKTEKVSGAEDSPVKEEPVEISERDESIHEMTDGDVEEENDESMADDESHSSQRRSPQSHASSEYSNCTAEPAEKRIKRETSPALSTSSPSSTFPGADQLFTRAAMEAGLYPGIWFPPTSTTASGLPFPPFMPRSSAAGDHHHPLLSTGASRLAENGLSPASSAFSNSGSPKLPSPEPMLTAGVKRRNDTCEFCGKIFKNCSNLTVHRRSHTGEKPYKCQLCPYACAQSSKLTRHMRTHGRHGKDVYRCKFCCMPFSVPSTLEKHMRKCVENQQRAAAAAAAARGHLASPLHVPASTV